MGGTYLQFTMEVWYPPAQYNGRDENEELNNDPNLSFVNMMDDKTTTVELEKFLFLDVVL
eukprot:3029193-Ditylum_brightwellii.AAC.1